MRKIMSAEVETPGEKEANKSPSPKPDTGTPPGVHKTGKRMEVYD